MLKKTFEKNKGITLIALVVTIIVLIILAGVSISMLTGQNGILKQAQKAKEVTEKSQELEQVQLAVMSAYIYGNQKITKDNLVKELGIESNQIIENKNIFIYTSSIQKYYITLEGEVTISVPYSILNVGDSIKYDGAQTRDGLTTISSDNWEIYYVDSKNKKIYLIPKTSTEKGNIPISPADNRILYAGTADFKDSTKSQRFPAVISGLANVMLELTPNNDSSQTSAKATEYLLDSTNWKSYVNNYADYAIGGPTAELLNMSLEQESSQKDTFSCKLKENIEINTENKTSISVWNPNNYSYTGYSLGFEGEFNQNSISYFSGRYWLACPTASATPANNLWQISDNGLVNYRFDYDKYDYRPIVCLKYNTLIYPDEYGGYKLTE